jgi:general stress protein YciG
MIADENNAGGTEQSSEQSNTTATTPDAQTAPAVVAEPTAAAPTEERRPRRRGFAAMDRDRVKEIASKGGKAAHAAGTAHQFSSDEARNAGRKGGMAPHVRRGGVRRRPTPETTTSGGNGAGQGESSGDNR